METLGKEAVSEWINKLFTKTQDLGAELEKIFGNHNMAEAAKNLRAGGDIGLLDLQATAGRQQKQIEALTAGLQKVSAQLEVNRPAPQTVLNNQ